MTLTVEFSNGTDTAADYGFEFDSIEEAAEYLANTANSDREEYCGDKDYAGTIADEEFNVWIVEFDGTFETT